MELRSPDPTANPYLAYALIIGAGLEGIEKGLKLPPAVDMDLYRIDESIAKELRVLPNNLEKAIELAENSRFVKSVIGEEMARKYIEIKKEEALLFAEANDKDNFYKERYFRFI